MLSLRRAYQTWRDYGSRQTVAQFLAGRRRSKKMGKESKMARTKRARQDMLLADSRARLPVYSPTGRNKRKEAASTVKKAKGRKAKDSAAESQIGAKVEGIDGNTTGGARRSRYSQDDKDRQSDRGVEGEDKVGRRSASELGIEWIGSFCPDGQPHFLIGTHIFNAGSILKCRGCLKQVWLPIAITEAATLGELIGRFGTTGGYCRYLDKFPEVRMLMAKLQDLWYARQKISDDKQFMRLVTSTMEDKGYDRKE